MLYVSLIDYADFKELGVVKKVTGQMKAFSGLGYELTHVMIKNRNVYIDDYLLMTIKNKIDLFIRLPLKLNHFFRKSKINWDLVYIRKTYYTSLYNFWFSTLRKTARKVLLEVPTYPYKEEVGGWGHYLLLLDNLAIHHLKSKIDYIVTTQPYEEIYGIKTIKINNGYDFSVKKEINRERLPDRIRLICVSNFNFWHGLERLFYGIAKYKEQPGNHIIIELHLLGDGEEIPNLKKLRQELGLENIVFHGPQTGEELENLLLNADIGVGALGLYKRKLNFLSSLKNMEYCYYGLSFIIGYDDVDLRDKPFVFIVPNNESIIPMDELVNWFKNLKVKGSEIREAGRELYDWDKQIQKIVGKIK